MKMHGKFIISLDFELLWGVRDKRSVIEYGENIAQVWNIIPRILHLFEEYQVRATFATVGFLFASDREELLKNLPDRKPDYQDKNLSPYIDHILQLKPNESKYHFASQLIELIDSFPDQEIGTHTFSHYYCLEHGQTPGDFKVDLDAAIRMAKAKGTELKSIVFPRNQYSEPYITVCEKAGILCYRGNEKSWFYKSAAGKDESLVKRAFRLIDSYVNISGHHTYSLESIGQNQPFNIPASRFLRPYSLKLRLLESLKLCRIKMSMSYAAKNNEVYHLWWHPHNFGSHTEKNFKMLQVILDHYKYLNEKYHFESSTMGACAKEFIAQKQ